jgi:acetyl esterase/lipase
MSFALFRKARRRGDNQVGTKCAVLCLTALFLTIVPAAISGSVSASASSTIRPSGLGPGETTLTYCVEGGVRETLDVYEPEQVPDTAVPFVVYVHGGGWTGGSSALAPRSFITDVESSILAKGWVFVSIDYRLAPRFRWPDQVVDAKCAVRFLRAEAEILHVDPNRVGAIGESAGGQIVALLGLAGPDAGFDIGQYAKESSNVQAVVDLCGPSDLSSPEWRTSPFVEAVAPGVFGALLGPTPAVSAAHRELTAASPVSYIKRGEPPFLIMHGSEDTVVPPAQSVELAGRLRAAGDDATLVIVKGAQHELGSVGTSGVPGISELAGQASAFLVRNLT